MGRRYAYRVEDLSPYRINPLLHRGLAVKVARRFLRPGLDLDDLVQEALTALCVAARNYDDSKGATFATWAVSLMTNHLKGVVRSDTRMGSFGGRGANTIYPNALRRYIRGGGKDLSVAGLREMFKDVPHSSALTDYDPTFLADARRYEVGTLPVQDFAGLVASITLLLELGPADVGERLDPAVAAHHVAARVAHGVSAQALEAGEEQAVDELQQGVAGHAFGIGRPVAPAHPGMMQRSFGNPGGDRRKIGARAIRRETCIWLNPIRRAISS